MGILVLASFASNSIHSKGRLFKEDKDPLLSPYEVDIHRIIESKSFRRLEYKTQVFFTKKEDHYRNRLTHSLEAAEIAKTISKALNLEPNLAEAITLAHDLGHAPFGHAGEDALNEVLAEYGLGFNHNLHTVTIVTQIEQQYPQFDGLNLSLEVIDGLIKHNGTFNNKSISPLLASYAKTYNLDLYKYSTLEAQVSSLSDDIAYNNHDLDDGFRAGLISIDELEKIDMLSNLIKTIKKEYPTIKEHILIYETIRRMRYLMIMDLVGNTKKNLKKHSIETIDDVFAFPHSLVNFSSDIESYNQEIRKFLMDKVYQNHKVIKITHKAKRMIRELFNLYMENLSCLPPFLQKQLTDNPKENALVISNFIAGMSDRYCISEYRSFFELSSSYIK